MCVEDPTYINGITKRLYHDIATKRNTVATRVERAIRHAITLMFNTGSNKTDIFIESFGEKDSMTNKTFIATFTENLAESPRL